MKIYSNRYSALEPDSSLVSKAGERMSAIQDTSNDLVDSILALADNLPEIYQRITEYDAKNLEYGDSISDELIDQLDWVLKQLTDVVHDVDAISDFFLH